MQYRKTPPTRRSTEMKGAVNPFGPHHCFISRGSVRAFHTRSGVASKVLVMTSSFFLARPLACSFFGRASLFFGSSTNSAKRSIVSRAPSSIPEASIPSRSSTVAKTDFCVTFVLPRMSSNTALSTRTRPGIPSNSKVSTIRSKGTTSRYSPWKPYSFPSASRWTNRQVPPGRTSIFSTTVEYFLGPHQRGISFGFVHAFHTSSRGASKTCVLTSSRFDVLSGLPIVGMFSFLLSFFLAGFLQVFGQPSETVLPQDSVARQPTERRAERRSVDLATADATVGLFLQQSRRFEDAKVPRDGRQAYAMGSGQLADRGIASSELLEHRAPDWMGQSREDRIKVQGDRSSFNHLVNR